MAAIVWHRGAYRVRRLTLLGFKYVDRVDGYWWLGPNEYNCFATPEEAEAAWIKARSRRIKSLKAKGTSNGQA